MEREVPIINDQLLRFNSFGELHNAQHLLNFFYIAEKNPETMFALWTKRADIVRACPESKPDNLVLIHSILGLDTPETDIVPEPWADYIYSVYTSGNTCGDKCLTCRKCYTMPENKGGIIRQLLH